MKSDGVPHFSEEWLAAYKARIRQGGETAAKAEKSTRKTPKEPNGQAEDLAAAYRTRARARRLGFSPYETPSTVAALPVIGWDGKQTETEKRYNRLILGGKGRFEAVTLYLAGGGRYTPDFMTLEGGVVTFHEVKGNYRLPSQGRALTAFQEAAAAFPCFRFVWAVEEGAGRFRQRVCDPKTIYGAL